MKKLVPLTIVLGALMIGFSGSARASALAFDAANDSVYSNGWTSGDNGGSGFGAWTLTGSANSGQFIGSSTGNFGSGATDIDVAGQSFGMFANSGATADAVRPFTGDLSIGQTFQIDFDNGGVQNGGTVGLGLQNSSGNNRIEFFFVGGNANYTIQTGSSTDTGIGFTGAGLRLAFTLTAANTMDLVVKNSGGSTLGTFTGLTLNNSGGIDRVRLFNFNAGAGSSQDAYYNSMQIIPEPSTALLVILSSLGMIALRRRKA